MQLCISNIPIAKVHTRLTGQETTLQCTNEKCTRQHNYVSNLKYKSTYTQGFTTQGFAAQDLSLLDSCGFSSYTYRAPTEDDIPPSMRFLINQGKIDFTKGWRKASTVVSLLSTHWQDYDPKENPLTPQELSKLWEESARLNTTTAYFLPSSSGIGVRIIYEGKDIPNVAVDKSGKNILIAERTLIEQELGITLDKTKASPGAHSGHLKLSLPKKIQETLSKLPDNDHPTRYYTRALLEQFPEIDTKEYTVYPQAAQYISKQADILEVNYSTQVTVLTAARDVGGYDADVFDELRPKKGSVAVTDIAPTIVLPQSFVLYQGNKPITPAELALQCLDRQRGTGGAVATNVPYAQDKQYNSRLDSALWFYSEEKGTLFGHEEGETTNARLGYTPNFNIPLRISNVAQAPVDARQLTSNIYLSENKLYSVIKIGHSHSQVLSDAAEFGFLSLPLLAEVFPYLMKVGGKDRFFLVPNNPVINLPDHYTAETLLRHLEGLNFKILGGYANEQAISLSKDERLNLKLSLQYVEAFLLSNCPDIQSTNKKFGYPVDTPHSVHEGVLTTYNPMVGLLAPESERPTQDMLEKARKFMLDYQGYDVELDARFVTARMYDIMPDGYRQCYTYDNRVSGSGKSEIAEVAAELKIKPDIDPEELLEIGLNGMSVSSYGAYRSVTLDEADQFPKLVKFLRKATGKGVAARASYGVSEQVRISHLTVCSAQGVKDLADDVIDDQERDRMYEVKQASTEKFKALFTRGKVPLSYVNMRRSLAWLMYEAFLKYEKLWSRETILTTELIGLTQESVSGSPLGRICMRVLGYGIRRLKTNYLYQKQEGSKHNKYPACIVEKPAGADEMPIQAQKPYSRVEDSKFYDGIHLRNKGQVCIDSVDVIFDAIDELNEPARLKTRVNDNKKLIPLLLGKPFKRRVARGIISGLEEFKGSYMAISEFTIPEDILEAYLNETYVTPKPLLEMSIDKMEEMYVTGSRLVTPNYGQLAEIVIEYTRRTFEEVEEEEVSTATQHLNEEEVSLW